MSHVTHLLSTGSEGLCPGHRAETAKRQPLLAKALAMWKRQIGLRSILCHWPEHIRPYGMKRYIKFTLTICASYISSCHHSAEGDPLIFHIYSHSRLSRIYHPSKKEVLRDNSLQLKGLWLSFLPFNRVHFSSCDVM